MTRNRSISNIIGNKLTKRLSRIKKDNKVPCYCNKCNGKLVLNRTKLFHESTSGSSTIRGDSAIEQLFPNFDELILDTGSPAEIELQASRSEMIDDESQASRIEMTDRHPKLPNLPRRRTRRYISHPQVTDDLSDSEDEQHTESSLSDNYEHNEIRHIESPMSEDESELDDLLISETFEDYFFAEI